MKLRNFSLLIILVLLSISTRSLFSNTSVYMDDLSGIFPLGNLIESENYTGKVWINELSDKEHYLVANLVFEPGCHNRWHYHPDAEQLILVVEGEGFYQIQGEPVQLLTKGDVVNIPAGAIHWQGATADNYFVHLTITDHSDKGHVVWLDAVSDQEYNSGSR